MQKIFEAYASRRGLAVDSLRFAVDGDRVQADHSPKMLELEENDQIDVLLQQTGGYEAIEIAPSNISYLYLL